MFELRHSAVALLVFSLLFASCRHKKDLIHKTGNTDQQGNPLKEKLGLSNKEIKSSKLYSFVDDWYGVPYKFGGCQKSGVDCSCFTDVLYQQVYGLKTPRTCGDIYKSCQVISRDKIKQGDILFFKINSNNITHVGVYLKDQKFVHASTSKGVIISDLNESYYKKYFYTAGRLKHAL